MRSSTASVRRVDAMVLTVRVVITGNGHTRRGLLGAAALSTAALAGCGIFDNGPDKPDVPDPLQPMLDEAVALAATYERAAVAQPGLAARLTPLGTDHRAHIAALSKVLGKAIPSGAPAPSAAATGDPATVLKDIRAAEQAAQKTAVAACRTTPADRAALVGSIAACRATHAEALK
jgi:hypothetical protein